MGYRASSLLACFFPQRKTDRRWWLALALPTGSLQSGGVGVGSSLCFCTKVKFGKMEMCKGGVGNVLDDDGYM